MFRLSQAAGVSSVLRLIGRLADQNAIDKNLFIERTFANRSREPMIPESRPSSEQGLESAVNVAGL
jgi:hypothetical protein